MVQLDFFEPDIAIPTLSPIISQKLEKQEPKSVNVANLQVGVQSKANKNLATEFVSQEEDERNSKKIHCSGHTFDFVISSRIKESTYEYDNNHNIKSIVFLIRNGDKTYKFKVGISPYSVANTTIRDLRVSHIHKLDQYAGGARFNDASGEIITNFGYFKRLFKGLNIHQSIMPLIREAILDNIHQDKN